MARTVDCWHMNEKPFEGVCDSRFFFESEVHKEALARLRYLATEESMMLGMLTGDVGCGKTTTLHRYSYSIDPEVCLCLVFENSFFSMESILSRILRQFGLQGQTIPSDFGELYELMDQCLDQLREHYHRHLLLIFDEAQDLNDRALSGICRLSNLNRDGGRRLSIVLVGQPELRNRVEDVAALDQRISLRFHLAALKPFEIRPYLDHRLQVAGANTGLFDPAAVEAITTASRGIPREINRLAKLSMEDAASRGMTTITGDDVLTVVSDLKRHHPRLATGSPILHSVRP